MTHWEPRYSTLSDDGVIYFAGCNDYVKIGFTRLNPRTRIKTLECGNPFPVTLLATMAGTVEIEQQLHERFAEHHFRGEWFILTEPIREFMNDVQNAAAQASIDEDRLAKKHEREQNKRAEKNIKRRQGRGAGKNPHTDGHNTSIVDRRTHINAVDSQGI